MSGFVARHKQDWDELATLVEQARRREKKLTAAERQRIDELYRRTTVHLAQATAAGATALTEYLNGLAASAHGLIYLPSRQSLLRRLARFTLEGFPRAVARQRRFHLISALMVLTGGLVGYFAAMSDPMTAHALWPAADERQPGSTPEQLLAGLRQGREDDGSVKFAFASFLFQHNLKVAVLAMATGVLAAVPTTLLMILNGMLLGVFVAIHARAGIETEMWAWILPHGITEFGAIILCGGIGLALGRAIVRPGAVSRTQSLLAAGREASRACVGAAGMLIAAAVIESYVRQSHWSTTARFVFAGGTALFWASYFAMGLIHNRETEEVGLQTAMPALIPVQEGSDLKAGSVVVVQRID